MFQSRLFCLLITSYLIKSCRYCDRRTCRVCVCLPVFSVAPSALNSPSCRCVKSCQRDLYCQYAVAPSDDVFICLFLSAASATSALSLRSHSAPANHKVTHFVPCVYINEGLMTSQQVFERGERGERGWGGIRVIVNKPFLY